MVLHELETDHDVHVSGAKPATERLAWSWLPYVYLLRAHLIGVMMCWRCQFMAGPHRS
jgi:hypothetical protein